MKRDLPRMFALVLAFGIGLSLPMRAVASSRGWWDDSFARNWLSGRVECTVVDGPLLYAGGFFRWVGNRQLNHVAVWDGSEWKPIGSGLPTPVMALGIHQGDLIAACPTNAGSTKFESRVYRWDGFRWRPMGGIFPRRIRAIDSDGERLVVGIHGSYSIPCLYEWNDEQWIPIDDGVTYGRVWDVEFVDSELMVIGDFHGDFVEGAYVLRTGVPTWEVVGEAVPEWNWKDAGYSLRQTSSGLVAEFSPLGSDEIQLHRLENNQWQPIPGISWNERIAFAEVRGHLILGGGISEILPGVHSGAYGFFAVRTPSVQLPVDHPVRPAGPMWAYGEGFTFLNFGVPMTWDGGVVTALAMEDAGGLVGPVAATVPAEDGGFYAGGSFEHRGPREVRNIGLWTGQEWMPVGGGVDGAVTCMVWHEGELYVGGKFNRPNGLPFALLARWTGDVWDYQLPTGESTYQTWRLVSTPEGLVAHGVFGYRILRNGVAEVIPENERPDQLVWHPDGLISAGKLPTDPDTWGIQQWDGNQWNIMSDDEVYQNLCVVGSTIYGTRGVGYREDYVCSVVSWDGSQWNLVTEAPGHVWNMAVHDGRIYATVSVDDPARDSSLYEFDGVTWNAIPSAGLGYASSLTATDESLIVSGGFVRAGYVSSGSVAVWHFAHDSTPVASAPGNSILHSVAAAPNPANPRTVLSFHLEAGSQVRVDVFDAKGRRVVQLLDGTLAAGRHTVVWNGTNAAGDHVASGVYRIRAKTPRSQESLSVAIVK